MNLAPLFLTAVLAQAAPGPIMRVGEIAITGAEITARAHEYLQGQGTKVPEPDSFVNGLIDELLLAGEAQRSGLAASPDTRAAVDAARAKVLAREYWEREILADARPPDRMVRDIFHEGRDRVRLRLVVLSTRPEAEAARGRLAAGGDFALEASRSLHRSGTSKGDTGMLSRRELDPALAKVAFEAPKGALFGPVALSLGFAVAEVTERVIADENELPAERPMLESFAKRLFAGQAKAHFLEMSRKKRGAVLDKKFLESLGKSTTATEAQADYVIAMIDGSPVRFRAILPELQEWAGRSHMFGPSIRIRVAEVHLDNLLLAAAATEARLQEDPSVAAALRISDLSVLARRQAARIAAGAPASAPPQERDRLVATRLEKLRKQLPVTVDRPAAIAAVKLAVSAGAPSAR